MKKFLVVVVLTIAGIAAYARYKQPTIPQPLPTITIGAKTTIFLELAQTPQEQEQGLSGRQNLPENHGMLFIFPAPGIYSFWMKDMRIPLDFLWIDSENTVVDMHENIPAPDVSTPLNQLPKYHPKTTIAKVLEVNAGFIKRHNIAIGDSVTIREVK